MILWTNKDAIGSWKLTEVEEWFFGGDSNADGMHK